VTKLTFYEIFLGDGYGSATIRRMTRFSGSGAAAGEKDAAGG
jgi:hypothetical protein